MNVRFDLRMAARRLGTRWVQPIGTRVQFVAGQIRRGLRRAWLILDRGRAAAVRFWGTVRPTTRRGAILGLLAIATGAAALAVVFVVGAMVLWSPYVESVARPDGDARAWAALDPMYAGTATCAECHPIESAKAASASHAGIGCESCHGAQFEHVLASPGAVEIAATMTLPSATLCSRCHVATTGRPDAVRQIVPAEHYVAKCLQCHDPHTGISRRPPVVIHTLDKLPPCVTCHGPDGFKARNQRHPVVSDDEACLSCHGPGRGPEVSND